MTSIGGLAQPGNASIEPTTIRRMMMRFIRSAVPETITVLAAVAGRYDRL
jgi:hypothetical protein